MTLTFSFPVHAGLFSSLINFITGNNDVNSENSQQTTVSSVSLPLLGSRGVPPQLDGVGGPADTLNIALPSTQDSALIAPRNPLGIFIGPYNDRILLYTVQPGDTPGTIAKSFGISLNTLLWANNIKNPDLIRVGDELIILPVSGIQYEVQAGDTIESIAEKFKGDVFEIIAFNGLAIKETLKVGTTIIIPDGELALPSAPPDSVSRPQVSSLPVYSGYYLRPILGGRRSRGIHGFNAVDLAQSCGSPILAAAEGTIILARSSGWNGGYGRYVIMSHPNGTQTLYAHVDTILVRPGQYVSQGSQIATVGTTGNSTGCHLHFEVRGAKNPF